MIRRFCSWCQCSIPPEAWAATGLLLVLRITYVLWWTPYGLSPDEAQYWSWLAHNDWSFLTKPPLTTWLMGIGTALLGKTMLGVKLFALLGQGVAALVGFAIARRVAGQAAGWWAWALLTAVPLIFAGGLMMSPDAVLLPLWLVALLMVVRAADKPQDEALCWPRWVMIGVVVGLAGLAKYTAGFFYPLLGLWLLGWRRGWLKHPQVWVSGLIALALQAPVVIWNMQHGWVGVSHVLWQADGGDSAHGGLGSVGEFIGGQALVLGPVVFGLMVWAWGSLVAQGRKLKPVEALLVVMGLPIFGIFTLLALHSKVQANWALLGAVGGLLVLAVWLGRRKRDWVVKLGWAGVALSLLLGVMLLDTTAFRHAGILPLKAKNDPTKDLRGWPEMGQLLALLLYKTDRPVVMASRYQTLAPLMFHTPADFEVAYMNAEGRRLNQYDLWPVPDLKDRLVVYVNENNTLPTAVAQRFKTCTAWHTLAVEDRGEVTRRLALWVCIGAEK